MPVLDYAGPGNADRRGHAAVVIVTLAAGAAIGFGAIRFGYVPMLELISRGGPIYVAGVNDPFNHQARYTAAFVGCGLLVASGALAAGRTHRRVGWWSAWWFLSLTLFFAVGASLGLAWARNVVDDDQQQLAALVPLVAGPGSRPVTILGLGTLPLESLPVWAVPSAGCAAVLVVLAGFAFFRRQSRRRAA